MEMSALSQTSSLTVHLCIDQMFYYFQPHRWPFWKLIGMRYGLAFEGSIFRKHTMFRKTSSTVFLKKLSLCRPWDVLAIPWLWMTEVRWKVTPLYGAKHFHKSTCWWWLPIMDMFWITISPYLTAFVLKKSSKWEMFCHSRKSPYLCLLCLLPVINLMHINLLTLTRPFSVISSGVAR